MVVSRQCVGAQSQGAVTPGSLNLIAQRGGDGSDDLVLYGRHVQGIPIIMFGPKVATGRRIDQLRANSHTFANPANTAFSKIAYSQVSRRLGHVSTAGPIPE
jgi:hypothetical protein